MRRRGRPRWRRLPSSGGGPAFALPPITVGKRDETKASLPPLGPGRGFRCLKDTLGISDVGHRNRVSRSEFVCCGRNNPLFRILQITWPRFGGAPFLAFPAKSTGYVWGAEAQTAKSFIFPKSRRAPAANESVPERSSSSSSRPGRTTPIRRIRSAPARAPRAATPPRRRALI
jgi:hypothetical protein